MKRSRSSVLGACFLPLIGLLLLIVIVAAGFTLSIPSRAEKMFGPPSPGLSPRQRYSLSFLLLLQARDLNKPADPNGNPFSFQVELGESTPSMIERLWQEGLIPNQGAFRSYLQYTGFDTTLQAGDYTLSPAMTSVEIAHALQDATPKTVEFNVLAGWRLEEIAASLPTSGLVITPEEFLSAAQTSPAGYSFSPEIPAGVSSEGFMFPDTYELPRDIKADAMVNTLLNRFETQVGPDIREGIKQQGLSLFEGVILASIVERESIVEEEMPLIASVYLNRRTASMKLDADPTVQYAIGYNTTQHTWWTNPLSMSDLEVDSPYNTYLINNLPPGPICNPSLNALHAVAFPAQTPYYYFRAACDGSGKHLFAETFEQHKANSCP